MNQHFFTCFLDRFHGFNTKLELLFFEVLNTSQIYPITSKVRFVKGLANYIKYVPNKKEWKTQKALEKAAKLQVTKHVFCRVDHIFA